MDNYDKNHEDNSKWSLTKYWIYVWKLKMNYVKVWNMKLKKQLDTNLV